ncbi:MAG: hypothetical protein WDM86_20650 [Rhizomicrobium sp.]
MTEREFVFEDFSDKVGDEFVIAEEGLPPIAFKLVEAELLSARHAPAGTRPPFSLIFTAQTPRMPPQRLYRLANDKLGTITLFLVPIGRDERGFLHQALFN